MNKMNSNQIAKELENRARQLDRKGILKILNEIPDLYPSLIQHPNLQFLKDECSKLETKVKDWKWPSLTDKFFDRESLIKWSKNKPVPKYRTIIDDVCTFADLIRSFANRKGMPLPEANLKLRAVLNKNPYTTSKAAAEEVGCSESTIVNTAAWKTVKEVLKMGRKPRAQRLTDVRLRITPAEQSEIQKLVDEQEKDGLEDSEPAQGKKQRRIYPSV